MDYRIEQWINGPAGHAPLVDPLMVAVAAGAEAAFIALVLVWFAVGWWRQADQERQGAIAALLAAGVALALNVLIGHIWYRQRPFAAHPEAVHLLLPHTTDSSFPSDHAAAAFAIAVVLVTAHRRWGILALALAALVGYARIYVGDHYPTDVLAGAVLGCAAAIVLLDRFPLVPRRLRETVDRIMRLLHLLRAPSPIGAPSDSLHHVQ